MHLNCKGTKTAKWGSSREIPATDRS